ncbi:MAG: hypothetical protein ACRDKL_03545 [Solirubrobacteraceae bacterium]
MPVAAPGAACELALAGDDEASPVTLGERLFGCQLELQLEHVGSDRTVGVNFW